jgi:cysteine desulfuration protein SufE
MNIQEIEEEIIDEFNIFGKGKNKYNYLIKLGNTLSPIDSEYKIESNLIKGCQVKTWFSSSFKDGIVFYNIDSNSIIVKGFIVLILRVLSGQKPEDIKNAKLEFIDKIGLSENLSPVRANSLWKMVGRIKSDANSYL